MSVEELDIAKISTLEEALVVIKLLLHRVVELEQENGILKQEILVLKQEVANLKKNSSTSSKPPSSDITKAKSEQKQPGKRKIGAQAGHKANWRSEFKKEEIGQYRTLKLSCCPDCKSKIQATGKVITRQQAELVTKPVIVTEYSLHEGYCECCDKRIYPVLPGQLLGPKLITLFGYMKAAMGVSISELAEFSTEVLKLNISRGGVQNAIFTVSEALKPGYEELAQAIPSQKALHIDETGWKEKGKRRWVWLFCNHLIAYFVISKSRACQVLTDVLGDNFLGALTSDFYSAYIKYASPKQQFCLAHLIREIKFLTTLPEETSKLFGIKLLAYMRRLFRLWHNRKSYSPAQWQKKTTRFKADFRRLLFAEKFEKKTDASRIQRRLIKHWSALFRFLDEPELYEPTNNHAERTLRPLVRIRRAAQGSRGLEGSNWTARAASVVATCKLQQRSVWEYFLQAVLAKSSKHLLPSLVS